MNPEAFRKTIHGRKTQLFELKNRNGLRAAFTNYGARWVSFVVPDRWGCCSDIVLGFDSLQGYQTAEEPYHGAVIGRVAGRIRRGRIVLDQDSYQLSTNEVLPNGDRNHLHGGADGLSFRVWDAVMERNEKGEESVRFGCVLPHGHEGYPGELSVFVRYTLTNENAVALEFTAESDRVTPVSLCNHAYFNLDGAGEGSVLGHILQIPSRHFLETDAHNFCATGRIVATANTPMDFTELKKIGRDIFSDYYQLLGRHGYNTYFLLDGGTEGAVIVLQSEASGRRLEIETTEPGLQLYCGGYWSGRDIGKNQRIHHPFGGVALETHGYAGAMDHPSVAGIWLRPGQEYRQVTTYRYSVPEKRDRAT